MRSAKYKMESEFITYCSRLENLEGSRAAITCGVLLLVYENTAAFDHSVLPGYLYGKIRAHLTINICTLRNIEILVAGAGGLLYAKVEFSYEGKAAVRGVRLYASALVVEGLVLRQITPLGGHQQERKALRESLASYMRGLGALAGAVRPDGSYCDLASIMGKGISSGAKNDEIEDFLKSSFAQAVDLVVVWICGSADYVTGAPSFGIREGRFRSSVAGSLLAREEKAIVAAFSDERHSEIVIEYSSQAADSYGDPLKQKAFLKRLRCALYGVDSQRKKRIVILSAEPMLLQGYAAGALCTLFLDNTGSPTLGFFPDEQVEEIQCAARDIWRDKCPSIRPINSFYRGVLGKPDAGLTIDNSRDGLALLGDENRHILPPARGPGRPTKNMLSEAEGEALMLYKGVFSWFLPENSEGLCRLGITPDLVIADTAIGGQQLRGGRCPLTLGPFATLRITGSIIVLSVTHLPVVEREAEGTVATEKVFEHLQPEAMPIFDFRSGVFDYYNMTDGADDAVDWMRDRATLGRLKDIDPTGDAVNRRWYAPLNSVMVAYPEYILFVAGITYYNIYERPLTVGSLKLHRCVVPSLCVLMVDREKPTPSDIYAALNVAAWEICISIIYSHPVSTGQYARPALWEIKKRADGMQARPTRARFNRAYINKGFYEAWEEDVNEPRIRAGLCFTTGIENRHYTALSSFIRAQCAGSPDVFLRVAATGVVPDLGDE